MKAAFMKRFWKGEDENNFGIKCNKYIKFKNSDISYILDQAVLSYICDKCGCKDEKLFKE